MALGPNTGFLGWPPLRISKRQAKALPMRKPPSCFWGQAIRIAPFQKDASWRWQNRFCGKANGAFRCIAHPGIFLFLARLALFAVRPRIFSRTLPSERRAKLFQLLPWPPALSLPDFCLLPPGLSPAALASPSAAGLCAPPHSAAHSPCPVTGKARRCALAEGMLPAHCLGTSLC